MCQSLLPLQLPRLPFCSFHVVITTNAQRVRLHMSPKWYCCNVETPLMLQASSTFDRGIHSFVTSKAQIVILLTWSSRWCPTAQFAQLLVLDTLVTSSAHAHVRMALGCFNMAQTTVVFVLLPRRMTSCRARHRASIAHNHRREGGAKM